MNAFLSWLARLDQPNDDPPRDRPLVESTSDELGSLICSDGLKAATELRNLVQRRGDILAC